MDNIVEIIGPIIIGVIYVLGSIFGKKDKADDTTPEPLQDHYFEAEEEEYQRHVESRNGTQTITENGRQNPPLTPTSIPNLSRQHQQAKSEGPGDFSWDQSDDSYDNEMEVQLKKIEATKHEAALLQSQSAQKLTKAMGEIDNPKTTRRKSSYMSVRSNLKNPQAARSAFIYGEVLGPPVSLRKGTEVPGLTS